MKIKFTGLILFMLLLFTTSVVQAGNTSWMKGGFSFLGDQEACSYGKCFNSDQLNTSDSFFIQASPVSVQGKINESEIGYRFEPWLGYSETRIKYNGETGQEYNLAFDVKVKNIQFGTNLFADYNLNKELSIYAGPAIGFELNEISGDASLGRMSRVITTEYDSNFFYGAEGGVDYKIHPNLAFNAFGAVLEHSDNRHTELQSVSNLGTEIRTGIGLRFFWNS